MNGHENLNIMATRGLKYVIYCRQSNGEPFGCWRGAQQRRLDNLRYNNVNSGEETIDIHDWNTLPVTFILYHPFGISVLHS